MGLFRSRVIERAREAASAADLRTRAGSTEDRELAPPDFAALYREHYAELRRVALGFAEVGVAAIAIDRARVRVVGAMCLAAKAGEIQSGVIGRHSKVDLTLASDPALSLRHLAFVIEPARSYAADGGVRFRVLDLHTGNPPRDEEGRAVESLTAEGAVFLDLGRYALMTFVTGDPSDWPEAAVDGWACLPARVFVEERLASGSLKEPAAAGYDPSLSRALRNAGWLGGRTTMVSRHEGPVAMESPLVLAGEDPVGRLTLRGDAMTIDLEVGTEALERGVLVGRYQRCQASAPAAAARSRVSRVHLLVVRVAGAVHAVDLGTTNGTYREREGGELQRVSRVDLGAVPRLGLAGSGLFVAWSSAS